MEAVEAGRSRIGILGPSQERIDRLAAWYGEEHDRLVRFAHVLVRDNAAAEDLVQEAFLKMYRARGRVDEAGVGAYARQTIVNLARSSFRRRGAERRALARLAVVPGHEPDHAPAADLRTALLQLSLADRACLALRHYEGLNDREIGAMLGIGEAAAKKRVERALGRLRKLLAEGES